MKREEMVECEVLGGPVRVRRSGVVGDLELLKVREGRFYVVFWTKLSSGEVVGEVLATPHSESEGVSSYLACQFASERIERVAGL